MIPQCMSFLVLFEFKMNEVHMNLTLYRHVKLQTDIKEDNRFSCVILYRVGMAGFNGVRG